MSNIFQGDGDSSEEGSEAKKASRPTPAKKPRENNETVTASEKRDKSTPTAASATTMNRAPTAPGSAVRRNTIANVRICILCKGEGKKGGFNNGKAIDFKNKFMVRSIRTRPSLIAPILIMGRMQN